MGKLDSQILTFLKLLGELGSETEFQKTHLESQDPSQFKPGEIQHKLQSRSGPAGSFVSQNDIWLELGPPTLPSVQLLLTTNDPALVNKDQITILGEDLSQLPHGTYPFAQVILAAGVRLTEKQEVAIPAQISRVYQDNGCMYRAAQGRIWVRMRKSSIDSGLNFRFLSHAIFQSIYSQIPEVEACEAMFVTSDPQTVGKIVAFSEGLYQARREILKERFQKIGKDIYACETPVDCESCLDRPVCDLIKETVKVIKKRREEFFGKEKT